MNFNFNRRTVLKLGAAGVLGSAAGSSPVVAQDGGYQTDPSGVPQPANAAELQAALSDVPEHSLIECQPGTYEPDSTITIPDTVKLDARGSTIVPQHNGVVVDIGDGSGASGMPGEGESHMYGGTIELGSRGSIGVRNQTDGRKFWRAGPIGTHITATPGSGATGHQLKLSSGGRTNIYHALAFSCDGVDLPYHIQANSGFITSVNAHVEASDFVTAVLVNGSDTVAHTYTWVDLTPGSNTEHILVHDNPGGRRSCTEGWAGDKSAYNRFVWVQRTRKGNQGHHTHVSWDGYSSANDSSLVRDDTDANDTRVVDFSEVN